MAEQPVEQKLNESEEIKRLHAIINKQQNVIKNVRDELINIKKEIFVNNIKTKPKTFKNELKNYLLDLRKELVKLDEKNNIINEQQQLEIFLNKLYNELNTNKFFNINELTNFLIKNNYVLTNEESIFVIKLLIGNKIILNEKQNIYYFNKNYKPNSENSYWINFIPKYNSDSIRDINFQPTIPLASPIMKYANIYNKYSPQQTFGIQPMDKYNKELLSNVHPLKYTQPIAPINGYNLIAIGAGAAGLVSAIGASRFGGKCAIIDCNLFGGDCLNNGCIPSKTLLKSAKLIYDLIIKNNKNKFGININQKEIKINFQQIMERMRKIRAKISYHDSLSRFSNKP
eukprot:76011_1